MKSKKEEKEYLSLEEATKHCNYSQEYLSLRARQGKLKAVKIGRNWVTTEDWIKKYVSQVEEYNKRIKGKPKTTRKKIKKDLSPVIRVRSNFVANKEMPKTRKVKTSALVSLKKLPLPPENLPVEAKKEKIISVQSIPWKGFFSFLILILLLMGGAALGEKDGLAYVYGELREINFEPTQGLLGEMTQAFVGGVLKVNNSLEATILNLYSEVESGLSDGIKKAVQIWQKAHY